MCEHRYALYATAAEIDQVFQALGSIPRSREGNAVYARVTRLRAATRDPERWECRCGWVGSDEEAILHIHEAIRRQPTHAIAPVVQDVEPPSVRGC